MDYGKKRCHDSPTMGEEELHRAIMKAVQTVAMQNSKLLQTLKNHIAMTVKCNDSEDKELEIKVRLAEINEEFQKAMDLIKSCDSKLKEAEDTINKIVDENKDIVEFNQE